MYQITYLQGYGYAFLLFLALYGEYLSKNQIINPVITNAATMLSQTSSRNTVINLKSDVFRTGFRITKISGTVGYRVRLIVSHVVYK